MFAPFLVMTLLRLATSKSCLYWKNKSNTRSVNPIWHLPILQVVKHARFLRALATAAQFLERAEADLFHGKRRLVPEIKDIVVDLERLRMTINEKEQEAEADEKDGLKTFTNPELSRLKVDESIKRELLAKLQGQLKDLHENREEKWNEVKMIQANHQQMKIAEAMFENAPQFILLTAIVLQTGVANWQFFLGFASNLESLARKSYSFFENMPNGQRAIRAKSSIVDRVLITATLLLVAAPRTLVWILIIAFFDGWSILIILLACGVLLGTWYCCHKKTVTRLDFVGLLVALIVPCVTFGEKDWRYFKSGLYSTLALIGTIPWILLRLQLPPAIDSDPPIIFCYPLGSHRVDNNSYTRCHYSLESNATCIQTLLSNERHHDYVTVCNLDNVNVQTLCSLVEGLIAALLVSLVGQYFLQVYQDPLRRLGITKVATFGFWPSWDEKVYKVSIEEVKRVRRMKANRQTLEEHEYGQLLQKSVQGRLNELVRDLTIPKYPGPSRNLHDFMTEEDLTALLEKTAETGDVDIIHRIFLQLNVGPHNTNGPRDAHASTLLVDFLEAAVRHGHQEVLREFEVDLHGRSLFEVEIRRKDVDGRTLLTEAIRTGKSQDFIEFLVSEMKRLELPTASRIKTDDLKPGSPMYMAVIQGNLPAIKLLLETEKPFLNDKKSNCKILQTACQFGHLDVLEFFYQHHSDTMNFFQKDQYGYTLLHSAAKNGELLIIQWLLEEAFPGKWDLYQETRHRHNVIHLAAENGHLEVLEYFKDKGMDFFREGTLNPFNIAVINGFEMDVRWMVEVFTKEKIVAESFAGTDFTAFHHAVAAKFGTVSMIETLLSIFGEVTCSLYKLTPGNASVIHLAGLHENLDTMRFLIEKYPSRWNFAAMDDGGGTPLHHAVGLPEFSLPELNRTVERLELVKLVCSQIDSVAVFNIRSNDEAKQTALEIAERYNLKEIADAIRARIHELHEESRAVAEVVTDDLIKNLTL